MRRKTMQTERISSSPSVRAYLRFMNSVSLQIAPLPKFKFNTSHHSLRPNSLISPEKQERDHSCDETAQTI